MYRDPEAPSLYTAPQENSRIKDESVMRINIASIMFLILMLLNTTLQHRCWLYLRKVHSKRTYQCPHPRLNTNGLGGVIAW